ncbi:MAG TPA: DUF721 domain-containing protein [Candidatus Limnocylindria bacterium]|nr:DUF721 domain-containing protein [Candidatus Limnocylindria bacterium]
MSDQRSRRRRPSRLADVLPGVASALGIDEQLRFARQVAAWQRLVGELVPIAAGSTLLAVQPPALVVSAASGSVAQELRLRQAALLATFEQSPEGERLLELRVVIRANGPSGGRSNRASGAGRGPV